MWIFFIDKWRYRDGNFMCALVELNTHKLTSGMRWFTNTRHACVEWGLVDQISFFIILKTLANFFRGNISIPWWDIFDLTALLIEIVWGCLNMKENIVMGNTILCQFKHILVVFPEKVPQPQKSHMYLAPECGYKQNLLHNLYHVLS